MAWIVALADEFEIARIESIGHKVERVYRNDYVRFFDCLLLDAEVDLQHCIRVWVDCSAENLLK